MAAFRPSPLVNNFPHVDFIGGVVIRGVVKKLPDAVSLIVLSCLSLTVFTECRRVSRRWRELTSDPLLLKRIIYYEKVFSSRKWIDCLNEGSIKEEMKKDEDEAKEFASLPPNFVDILKKSCPVFPGKRVIDTHRFVRLPKGFTLNSLGELAKKYFPENENGYRWIWEPLSKDHGDKSVGEPIWLLMTTDNLPGSQEKSYAEQKILVAKLATDSNAPYKVPKITELVAFILAWFISSSQHGDDPRRPSRLYSDSPWSYTHAEENVRGFQAIVGGFSSKGLFVSRRNYENGLVGIAAVQRFS